MGSVCVVLSESEKFTGHQRPLRRFLYHQPYNSSLYFYSKSLESRFYTWIIKVIFRRNYKNLLTLCFLDEVQSFCPT